MPIESNDKLEESLAAVCDRDVLHIAASRELLAVCIIVDSRLNVGSRLLPISITHHSAYGSYTQGFENLLRSILMHVLSSTVDIIVCGAWLCTSSPLDEIHSTSEHCRVHLERESVN